MAALSIFPLVMPNYDYECRSCGHNFETFQSMLDDALSICPECGKEQLRRLISGGSGIIFKGTGFYVNDSRQKPPETGQSAETSKESGTDNNASQKASQKTDSGKSVSKKTDSSSSKSGSSNGDRKASA